VEPPGAKPKTPERADPLTRLLANRVIQLRERVGMSQAQLGQRMGYLRPSWTRSTVAKFERGLRGSVSIDDAAALAVCLDVPMVMLLTDPRAVDTVPLFRDAATGSWDAFAWWIGAKTLDGHEPLFDDFAAARWLANHAIQLGEALHALEQNARVTGTRDPVTGQQTRDPGRVREITEERDRELLTDICEVLYLIKLGDTPLPTLPEWVHKRAAELDVALPTDDADRVR
jgi:transcriptional regulator with XRE-family HTH domain